MLLCLPQLGSCQQAIDLIIHGGNYFDTESGTFRKNAGIAIADGRFVALNAAPKEYDAKKTIELEANEYILPGLIDCHAHYNVRLIRKRREEFEVMPVIYLANGVTTTFSCGEFAPEQMLELRKDIENGRKVGPNLINSGPYFGRARPSWRGIRTEDEIKEEVDFWAGQGVGGFKAKAISPTELEALCKHAKRHGLTVTGHLGSGFRNSVNPRDAIDLGIDRIEHFLGGDAMPESRSAYASLANITRDMDEYKKIAQKFVDTNTVFDATLTAYGYESGSEEFSHWVDERQFFTPFIQERVKKRGAPRPIAQFQAIYEAKLKTISAFFEAGGAITLGSDHVSDGNFLPGFGVHRELDAFVRGGIPEADAIRIGTINGARALGIDKDYGSLEEGKIADLFVVTGNPLENIRNSRNIKWLLRAGQFHRTEDLFESVKGKLGPASDDEVRNW